MRDSTRLDGGDFIADEKSVKALQLLEKNWADTARLIAPDYGVDADALLRKMAPFPVNHTDPGQFEAWMNDTTVKSEDLTEAEVYVCKATWATLRESLLRFISQTKSPYLPEFSERPGAGE